MNYSRRRVIVAGGGGTGMGASAVHLALARGAEVFVLDLRPPSHESAAFIPTDLSDPHAIDAAVARIGGPIHALFNCQGISGAAPDATVESVMRVNFLGVRHLSEAVVPRMPAGSAIASIASTGGLGWPKRLPKIQELIDTRGFDAGLGWVQRESVDLLTAPFPTTYSFSKQALIVWTMRRAVSAIAAGIRVNCTSPGSTRTQMAGDFPAEGVQFINRPSGRESVPDEQAWPLLFLNSELASYVNGVNLVVDGGHSAARTLGLLDAN